MNEKKREYKENEKGKEEMRKKRKEITLAMLVGICLTKRGLISDPSSWLEELLLKPPFSSFETLPILIPFRPFTTWDSIEEVSNVKMAD